jgi:hypothetical protein
MHCKPKKPSHRWSAVADLHTNTCNKTDIQQKHVEDVLYYKLYYCINVVIVSYTTVLWAGKEIQKKRVGCTPRVEGRVEIFKIFFFQFQQTAERLQVQFPYIYNLLLSMWKNQMSNNVNSDFNLIDFRTSRVPNLFN